MKRINKSLFTEMNDLADKQITSREELRKKYTALLEEALEKRKVLNIQKENASNNGKLEDFQRIKREIRDNESDIEDYEVGANSYGSVDISIEDIDNKLSTADSEIRKYQAAVSEEIKKDLDQLLDKLNTLLEPADSMKKTANHFSEAFKIDDPTPYKPSLGFDGYLYYTQAQIEYLIENITEGTETLLRKK